MTIKMPVLAPPGEPLQPLRRRPRRATYRGMNGPFEERYELGRCVGSGATSRVYEAVQLCVRRTVAISNHGPEVAAACIQVQLPPERPRAGVRSLALAVQAPPLPDGTPDDPGEWIHWVTEFCVSPAP